MPAVTVYRCDVCGKIKGEANKWLMVETYPQAFYVRYWDDAYVHDHGTKIVCGEGCLHTLLGPFLSART